MRMLFLYAFPIRTKKSETLLTKCCESREHALNISVLEICELRSMIALLIHVILIGDFESV